MLRQNKNSICCTPVLGSSSHSKSTSPLESPLKIKGSTGLSSGKQSVNFISKADFSASKHDGQALLMMCSASSWCLEQ